MKSSRCAGFYRSRHPERTVLFRVIFHHFDRFLSEYESRFQAEYDFLRPIIKEAVEKYLDCGNPSCGFAWVRCPDCGLGDFRLFGRLELPQECIPALSTRP